MGYKYRFKGLPLVTRDLIKYISGYSGEIRVTLSLGYDYESIYRDNDLIRVRGFEYNLARLKSLVREGFVYALDGGEVYPIAFFRGSFYYKLYPVAMDKAPTVEVSGIKMHRVVDIDPWRDTYSKVSILNIHSGEEVLDICTGLGYTAINAYRRGGNVLTIEVDENILEIASYNPWSSELEDIKIILGDATEVIKTLLDNHYDVIIHDPPRLSRAGELYSREFYSELYRVLRRGGRLFHYTGKVGYKRRRLNILGGVASRLAKVGFKVYQRRDLLGVYAVKR